MSPTLFTVGHSTHTPDVFASLLALHDVEALVNVRRYPGSRRVPWTNPNQVEHRLPVEYVHIPQLGGRRKANPESPNGFWRNESFRAYADYMDTAGFNAGLEALIELARRKRTTVMCAEGLWWRCHRRLVADAFVVREWNVCHIDPRGDGRRHVLTDGAVVSGARITYPSSGRVDTPQLVPITRRPGVVVLAVRARTVHAGVESCSR